MIAESVCADVVELDTDHTPHLSKTGELAEALHRLATHSFANYGVGFSFGSILADGQILAGC
jgi:hypothetical protein